MRKRLLKRHSNHALQEGVNKIRKTLAEVAGDMKHSASDMWTDSVDEAREKSTEIHDNLAEYIADKPFRSVTIALLAGIVYGYLSHRK